MENNLKNIVFISISSDLYGSSKLLLTLVSEIKNNSSKFNPIVCMPYEEGPLKVKLREVGIEIIEMPVLKLTRSMLRSLGFVGFFKEYLKARRIFEQHLKGRAVMVIQSNTLATLFGAIYCRNKPIPHIIHIHEIVDRPWFVKYFFGWVLKRYSDYVVYNSEATSAFYNKWFRSLKKKSRLIYNGIDRERPFLNSAERKSIRQGLFKIGDEVAIGLLGRFNRLKGHHVLLKAYKEIKNSIPKSKLILIGSPPEGQEHFREFIELKIQELGLNNDVVLIPFQTDVFAVIDSIDLMVVPSTEPESFGIIAVEAMLSEKAVIASDIGGLSNIINHMKDGLLVNPSEPLELAKAIKTLIDDPELKRKLEIQSRLSATSKFSSAKMIRKFNELYESISA